MENAKFYNKEDDFGNFGEIGMVKSYEIGYYTIDRLELDAKENDMSIEDFLKFWWNEISAECPFTWQRLGGGYGYNGTTLLVIGNVRFKDIYGQIMIDEYPPRVHKRTRPAANASNQIVGNIVKSVVRSVVSDRTNGTEKVCGLHFTIDHTGKMKGMRSISTSVTRNKFCAVRRKNPNSICNKCYAAAMLERNYAKCWLPKVLDNNTDILTSEVITTDKLPKFGKNCKRFRFEAFGDIGNVTQAINYLNMARVNPETQCSIFTKNLRILKDAIEQVGKPKNLNVVFSSAFINQVANVPQEYEDIVDIVFTVFAPHFIEETGININCGARNCLKCGKCYTKHKSLTYINEKLK